MVVSTFHAPRKGHKKGEEYHISVQKSSFIALEFFYRKEIVSGYESPRIFSNIYIHIFFLDLKEIASAIEVKRGV